jgi:uncharacterized membrane protein YagU involved in acid resistance
VQSIQPGLAEIGFGARQIRRDGRRFHETEDATERLAEVAARELLGWSLTGYQKQALGKVVHYLFGAGSAAAYACLAELLPEVTSGWGIPFGLAVWLGADEGTVPWLGLSTPAYRQPWSVQATSFGCHCAYGAASEGIRRFLRASVLA